MVFMRRRGYSNTWKIRLYRYGFIWKTLEVKRGQSVTLGACDRAYSDDTFYGWSTAYNSVTRTYTSVSNITPTADINLYAVFSYTANKLELQTYTAASSNSSVDSTTVTAKINHLVTFNSYYNSVSGSGTPPFSNKITGTSFVAISINGVIKASSSPIEYFLYTGDVITIYAAGYSGKASYSVWFNLPYYTQVTAYRVVSHG